MVENLVFQEEFIYVDFSDHSLLGKSCQIIALNCTSGIDSLTYM